MCDFSLPSQQLEFTVFLLLDWLPLKAGKARYSMLFCGGQGCGSPLPSPRVEFRSFLFFFFGWLLPKESGLHCCFLRTRESFPVSFSTVGIKSIPSFILATIENMKSLVQGSGFPLPSPQLEFISFLFFFFFWLAIIQI